MAAPDEPAPEIDLIFRDDFEPDDVTPQEIELLGSLYPELIAELIQIEEKK